VSDFGLAKAAGEIGNSQPISTRVMGTFGWAIVPLLSLSLAKHVVWSCRSIYYRHKYLVSMCVLVWLNQVQDVRMMCKWLHYIGCLNAWFDGCGM
jgi:hypothetical protein